MTELPISRQFRGGCVVVMDTHHTSGYTSARDDSFVIVFSRSLQCILQILRSTRLSDVEQRRFEAAKGKLPFSLNSRSDSLSSAWQRGSLPLSFGDFGRSLGSVSLKRFTPRTVFPVSLLSFVNCSSNALTCCRNQVWRWGSVMDW